jgi:hypothetical protein
MSNDLLGSILLGMCADPKSHAGILLFENHRYSWRLNLSRVDHDGGRFLKMDLRDTFQRLLVQIDQIA